MTLSTGTAAFAARGDSASSNSGTGSPSLVCIGPNGQSPRPLTRAMPSSDSHAMLAASRRSRRPVTTDSQMSARLPMLTTAHTVWATRNACAAIGRSAQSLRVVLIVPVVEPHPARVSG